MIRALIELLARGADPMHAFRCAVCLLIAAWSNQAFADVGIFNLQEATVADINEAFDSGLLTSEKLVQLYLNRIAAFDDGGPALNSMIALNPAALESARALDAERRVSGPRSALHGVPIVLKDLVDMHGMATTSGTLALRDSLPPDDAFIVGKLREAGAVILGKTNLDEFGCCSTTISSLGGQTKNPYDTTRVPGGSSGGSASAIAANLAVVGTGTDWWGSIQQPASLNNVVGLMPTRSLVSGDGMMPPPSERRGVMGPFARTVADAAAMLDIIVGVDANDPVTAVAEGHIPESYLDYLDPDGLSGARIGLVANFLPATGNIRNLFDGAVADMQTAGAQVVPVTIPLPNSSTYYNDIEYGANRYLESLGPNRRFETFADLIASGEVLPNQEGLLAALNGDIPPDSDPEYAAVVATRAAFEATILELMDDHQLDALIYPPMISAPPVIGTTSTVWESDADYRNMNASPFLGFPSITLPMGSAQVGRSTTLPFGIEFLGRPFSEPTLIELAYSFEQATLHRRPPASAPALVGESMVLGDTNGDGAVNIEDLNNVRNNFGGTGVGDTNSDGAINIVDLNNVRNFFGTTVAQPVPEPSTVALLLAAAMAIGCSAFHRHRRRMLGNCVVLCMFFMTGVEHAHAGKITEMFVFGDSHSDVGNWGPLTGEGRASNGPVWAEYLASELGLPALTPGFVGSRTNPHGGNDYAFSAARTGEGYDAFAGFQIPRVGVQVDRYLTYHQPTPETLLVLLAGHNDFLSGDRNPAATVNRLASHVRKLAGAGGTQFLVVSKLHSIGLTPLFLGTSEVDIYDALTTELNALLPGAMSQLESELGVTIHQFDLAALEAEVRNNPAAFGFTNFTEAAYLKPSADPDEYVYWDELHFSTAFHRIFGERAARAVPEPGSVVLAALGLASALACMRRRARSGRGHRQRLQKAVAPRVAIKTYP